METLSFEWDENKNAINKKKHKISFEEAQSGKTESGALESSVGWRGLCRKGMTLAVVLVACRLDMVIGSNLLRDADQSTLPFYVCLFSFQLLIKWIAHLFALPFAGWL